MWLGKQWEGFVRDKVTFRRAVASDLAAIVAMLADDNLGETREDATIPVNHRYIEALAAIDADENQYLAVVDVAGAVAGCLQISFIPGISRLGMWRGQIEGVRIAPAQRGSGLGGAFIRWAVDRCREKGCGLVQLTSDKKRAEAIRFYESLGFVASHEGMKISLALERSISA
jgi:ribosomal protein S18 acetylase RimI-like enzyme